MQELKILGVIFATVFLAELGDKTQLATLLFSADGKVGPFKVFLASGLALLVACAIGVVAGQWVARVVNPQTLKMIAGIGFIAIGAFTLYSGIKTTS